jgi:hypothetical protein
MTNGPEAREPSALRGVVIALELVITAYLLVAWIHWLVDGEWLVPGSRAVRVALGMMMGAVAIYELSRTREP